MQPDGSVVIMDRSKDIIISGGEVCLLCNVVRNAIFMGDY